MIDVDMIQKTTVRADATQYDAMLYSPLNSRGENALLFMQSQFHPHGTDSSRQRRLRLLMYLSNLSYANPDPHPH